MSDVPIQVGSVEPENAVVGFTASNLLVVVALMCSFTGVVRRRGFPEVGCCNKLKEIRGIFVSLISKRRPTT